MIHLRDRGGADSPGWRRVGWAEFAGRRTASGGVEKFTLIKDKSLLVNGNVNSVNILFTLG